MKIYFRPIDGQRDWPWIKQRLNIKRCEDTAGIMAVDTFGDRLVGACILDNWTDSSAQASFILDSSMVLRSPFIEVCAGYAFEACGLIALYSLIGEQNYRSVRLTKRIGFKEKVRLEKAFTPTQDLIVMELRKDWCNFMPQKKQEAA